MSEEKAQHSILIMQLETTIEVLKQVAEHEYAVKVGVMSECLQSMARIGVFTPEEQALFHEIAQRLSPSIRRPA